MFIIMWKKMVSCLNLKYTSITVKRHVYKSDHSNPNDHSRVTYPLMYLERFTATQATSSVTIHITDPCYSTKMSCMNPLSPGTCTRHLSSY